MTIRKLLLKFIYVLALAAAAAQAQPNTDSLDAAFNQLLAVRWFREVAVSPDGKHVAWVETLNGRNGEPTNNSAIYVSDITGQGARLRVTAATGTDAAENGVAWSPNSRQIAFLSNASGRQELYLAAVAKPASPRRLTGIEGEFSAPRWSPDGKRIAVLLIENPPRLAGPLSPMSPSVGVIEEHPYEQRVAIVELDGGSMRQVSPADLYVYEFDWSPDSSTLALIAAHGAGDPNWWVAQLYTMPVATGQITSIFKPELQIANPRWSPDGGAIAFIGGLMSDQGVVGGDVYLVHASGGRPRHLTPNLHASVDSLEWDAATKQLILVNTIAGAAQIEKMDPETGALTELWQGAESIRVDGYGLSISLSRDGRTSAMQRDSFERPPEVYAGPIGGWKQITNANAEVRPSWGKTMDIRWKSDQFDVQGWLLAPRDYDPKRTYPMVVVVHGGPSGAERSSWPRPFFSVALLSQHGYFVFMPNPRGSYGQGELFTRANVKDFGYGDLRDIELGIDSVVSRYPIEARRIGLTGWSYGGFMSMFAVTQTSRFRAAVAGAGIANWLSYYGENDIDEWMIPFFGASVYDDPQIYARSAPITFIKQVKTPTLVLVGERDGECPAPQSFEFWHALKALGVPTRLVVYPGEGHNIADPQHRRDIVRRTAEWFDRYMPAAP